MHRKLAAWAGEQVIDTGFDWMLAWLVLLGGMLLSMERGHAVFRILPSMRSPLLGRSVKDGGPEAVRAGSRRR